MAQESPTASGATGLSSANRIRVLVLFGLAGFLFAAAAMLPIYLVPRLAKGGVIIVDDYRVWDGCSRAVHDYLSETKSTLRIGQMFGVPVIR